MLVENWCRWGVLTLVLSFGELFFKPFSPSLMWLTWTFFSFWPFLYSCLTSFYWVSLHFRLNSQTFVHPPLFPFHPSQDRITIFLPSTLLQLSALRSSAARNLGCSDHLEHQVKFPCWYFLSTKLSVVIRSNPQEGAACPRQGDSSRSSPSQGVMPRDLCQLLSFVESVKYYRKNWFKA